METNRAHHLEYKLLRGDFEECLILSTMIIYSPCGMHFEFIYQNLHYKHKMKIKRAYHLRYRLSSGIKNDFILKFSHNLKCVFKARPKPIMIKKTEIYKEKNGKLNLIILRKKIIKERIFAFADFCIFEPYVNISL